MYYSCAVEQLCAPSQGVLEPCDTDVPLGCAAAPEEVACQLTSLASCACAHGQRPALRAIYTSPGIQHAAGCFEAAAADRLRCPHRSDSNPGEQCLLPQLPHSTGAAVALLPAL